MRKKALFAIIVFSALSIVACDPLPIGDDVTTPTREINYPTDTPVATEVPHVWLPGVNCDELAASLDLGFALINKNPCLQRVFTTEENGISQAYAYGYEVVSEPGLTSFGDHALIWYDTGQRAMVVEFTKNGTGINVNGLWGWMLRGQRIPDGKCGAIKITGQSMLENINVDYSPEDLIVQITINNGVSTQVKQTILLEYGYFEAFWVMRGDNPFDITFQVGQTWAVARGYVEVWSLQVLTAPDGFCDGNGVIAF